MTTNRKKQLLVSYLIGMTLMLMQVFISYTGADMNFYAMAVGSLLVIIPWILCLFDAARLKNNGLLWFFFIFFISGIGTPTYLLVSLSNEKKTDLNDHGGG